ncbi:hypothetical protein V1505DRAFT_85777 [Lipomyces doorenjongii]
MVTHEAHSMFISYRIWNLVDLSLGTSCRRLSRRSQQRAVPGAVFYSIFPFFVSFYPFCVASLLVSSVRKATRFYILLVLFLVLGEKGTAGLLPFLRFFLLTDYWYIGRLFYSIVCGRSTTDSQKFDSRRYQVFH